MLGDRCVGHETISGIFSYLPLSDLLINVSLVSREFHNAAMHEPVLWKLIACRDDFSSSSDFSLRVKSLIDAAMQSGVTAQAFVDRDRWLHSKILLSQPEIVVDGEEADGNESQCLTADRIDWKLTCIYIPLRLQHPTRHPLCNSGWREELSKFFSLERLSRQDVVNLRTLDIRDERRYGV